MGLKFTPLILVQALSIARQNMPFLVSRFERWPSSWDKFAGSYLDSDRRQNERQLHREAPVLRRNYSNLNNK